MTRGTVLPLRPVRLVSCAALACAIVFAVPPVGAADLPLSSTLCGVLTKLLPEVRGYKPEGARAQLVMAVAEKFNYDAAKLSRVKAEIDQATSAGCPKEREGMLGIVKMKSLAEAVS